MMKRLLIALVAAQYSQIGQAAAPRIDPVTARMVQFCGGRQGCVSEQRQGIQNLLREITTVPRPTPLRIRWCIERATNSKQLTNWHKAARCIRR